MSWANVNPATRAAIEHALTRKQLQALILELAGMNDRRIALALDISRRAARDRLDTAHDNLRRAHITLDKDPA